MGITQNTGVTEHRGFPPAPFPVGTLLEPEGLEKAPSNAEQIYQGLTAQLRAAINILFSGPKSM